MNLDLILKEFDNQNREDLEIIKAVLPYCSQRTCVSLAYYCALDIAHLNPDKRSMVALDAIALWLKDGTKIPQEVVDAAYAASYASASYASASYAAASYAAYAAAYAASYAADAAAYAASASAAAAAAAAAYAAYADAAAQPNTYRDKMRSYLNKLKELVLAEEVPAGTMSEDAAWLLNVVI